MPNQRICKYCGKEYLTPRTGSTCASCYEKAYLLPRFAKARDDLRVKCALPPLEQSTSDENTCSIVD